MPADIQCLMHLTANKAHT